MAHVLIIGAGITGPVTAMALQKAGIDSTIFEAYDRTADGVGAYLTLAVNGLAALRTVGIERDLLVGGFDTPGMVISSGTGRELGRFTMGSPGPGESGSVTIRRSDLYGALRAEAERRGVPVAYGRRLERAEATGRGVRATFADGSTAEGDLLIGADGTWSRTRTLLDPSGPRPRYTGLLNTGGYARGVQVPGDDGVFHMTFGLRAFFAYLKNPNGEVWWFANVPRRSEASREELAAITEAGWRAQLEDLFAEDRTPARAILRHTDEIALPWNTYDLPSVPRWHDDRMVLVGDAAHAISPTSGQGASLAIEDAVLVARCLRDLGSGGSGHSGDSASEASASGMRGAFEAFEAYEGMRRTRVETIIAQSKRMSDRKIPGAFSRTVRDRVVMPLLMAMMKRSGKDPMAQIHDFRIDWDSPGA